MLSVEDPEWVSKMMELIEKTEHGAPDLLDQMQLEYPIGSRWIGKTSKRRATLVYSGVAMVQLMFNENDPKSKKLYSHDDLNRLYHRM